MSVCIVLGCIQTWNTTVAAAYELLHLCSGYMLAKTHISIYKAT